jgi:hypothetical protein
MPAGLVRRNHRGEDVFVRIIFARPVGLCLALLDADLGDEHQPVEVFQISHVYRTGLRALIAFFDAASGL